jgi:hypothetical protein
VFPVGVNGALTDIITPVEGQMEAYLVMDFVR